MWESWAGFVAFVAWLTREQLNRKPVRVTRSA